MDEGLLNDLLECSVCLERLDTSSRVLPCQHTFCLKCLKVIVESHKELRCPECRVLVEAKVEELPPNVLLMRILEGMRNTPRKDTAQRRGPHQNHPQPNQSQNVRADMKLPPQARALYDYISQEPGDLSFKKGDTILLEKRIDPFWYKGECGGRTGIFPLNYVQIIVPLPAPTALCKALYDFRMSGPDEEGCLAFDKGAIITVHRRVDENWAEGRIEERVGIFPIAFVQLNTAARHIVNSGCLSRPVPPIPEVKPADHRHLHHTQQQHRYPTSVPTYQNINLSSHTQTHYTHVLVPTHAHTDTLTHTHIPHTDYIQLKGQTLIQGVSNLPEANRLRNKYDLNIKNEIYQNVRQDFPTAVASFNNTDSSSQVSSTTPNSSNSSSESAEPSTPSSPDNEKNLNPPSQSASSNPPSQPASSNPPSQANPSEELSSSMGVLVLNESSTATNTSLNVSLPAEGVSNEEDSTSASPSAAPSTSASVRSGPSSLLSLGVSLQASLSHNRHRDRDREKRHSLTHTHHHNGQSNRHSAEIVATSLLDGRGEGRRRRSVSGERGLPAPYVALFPYKPQKPDELELRKGAVYIVSERCRDGWLKGSSERTRRTGVFPGNYVAPTHTKHDDKPQSAVAPAPATPPRGTQPQPMSYPWTQQTAQQQSAPKTDKPTDPKRSDKHTLQSGVNLMRRLAAMKRSKSPQGGYCMDNPVFDIGPGTSVDHQGVQHVRSGSCPSQLLVSPVEGTSSHRLRTKHRPTVFTAHEHPPNRTPEPVWQSQHRKSQSLDVTATTRRDGKQHTQTVKERFRCIAPYPPNSEYELELKVDDIVLVHRKRGDGWYKGTLQRTGRTGLFPASFVQSCPAD